MVSDGSQLLLAEERSGRFSMVLRYGDGTEKRLPATTPAKDLITITEIDYRKYRGEIKRLRDEHPLFEVRPDISMADFEDFVAEALLLPAMIQKTDPVSFFVLGELLHQSLQAEDDGSASFLLHAAEELLYVLEDPIRTQVCMRNIFEMTFDGMERATQRERFEKLCRVYPNVGKLCDPASLPNVEPRQRIFRVNSIFGLRLLELVLYFQQDNLIPMDYDQYSAWSENTRLARRKYLDGKLTAREFLRQIDMTHELESYETDKAELAEETVWQRMVAGNFGFDAETHYPETMQVLDLGAEGPEWELQTADELRREDQKGHRSLREKYGKG